MDRDQLEQGSQIARSIDKLCDEIVRLDKVKPVQVKFTGTDNREYLVKDEDQVKQLFATHRKELSCQQEALQKEFDAL